MPSLTRSLHAYSTCIVLALLSTSHAHADQRLEAPQPAGAASPTKFELFNPVTLLGQAIASLIGGDAEPGMSIGNTRHGAALASRAPLQPVSDIAVRFAPNLGYNRVSLLLAESQLHVRLAQDLLLRCEVSSRDAANADAELTLDLGVQFKFE